MRLGSTTAGDGRAVGVYRGGSGISTISTMRLVSTTGRRGRLLGVYRGISGPTVRNELLGSVGEILGTVP
jgi:hypothetical protein